MPYRNILLIDDDEDDQELFLEAIDDLAESVVIKVLDNAKTALQVLESKQLMADLIFLDLNMPIMDGQDFLRAIKKNETLKEIPVIVIIPPCNPDFGLKEIIFGVDRKRNPLIEPVPYGVVTTILPVLPDSTVATISLSDKTVNTAAVPPKLTDVAFVK